MTSVEGNERIAIVGMAGRFPGARNVEELWQLLASGTEALEPLSDAQLRAAGVPESLLRDPSYVKACMRLDDPDLFDAEFFGYSHGQATSIDPQQRLFLECAWEALESAGYGAIADGASVGVFAGSAFSGHLPQLLTASHRAEPGAVAQYIIDADKDFLTTRTAYKLGLRGPAITVQTACSTSLVAVHLACRSLLEFECDMALAGGVTVRLPQERGYRYISGGIASPDGHCRAFAADANGCIGGSGVGIVVLRRLSDALNSRDQIHAVIRATAVNNDGSRKVGYSAPGLHGQAQLLATALALADLRPDDIGLIEAHGTGTPLGDSIELEALEQVYRNKDAARFCALGSVKTNVGHLDAAAGVTGLIKAVLCLQHKAFVPSLNFNRPNPILARPDCPFYVTTECRPWETAPGRPRRAGVSSFGIGGTNAHVILEEAPEIASSPEPAVAHVFPLSARDPVALDRLSRNLGKFLQGRANIQLGDVAFTLQTGRRRFDCRRVIVASDRAELTARLLSGPDECARSERSGRPIAFMFPGQGLHQLGIAAGLYETDEHFKRTLDRCAQSIEEALRVDVRGVLCGVSSAGATGMHDAALMQPAIFAFEYCLADLLLHWGVRPNVLIGHGFGEYAAACVGGVLSFEDGTRLVAERARLVSQSPPGAMVEIRMPEQEAREILGAGLSIAAIDTADQCVVSGAAEEVRLLTNVLRSRGVEHRYLKTGHAFHSAMMRPAAAGLREAASHLVRHAPRIPLVSCVTGNWLTEKEVADPGYWSDQLLLPVRFSAGLSSIARTRGTIFVEVGPGAALTAIARRQLGGEKDYSFIPCLEGAGAVTRADLLLEVVGCIWKQGGDVDWQRFHDGRSARRISLPTYPFGGRRYALPAAEPAGTSTGATVPTSERLPVEQWFYLPSWKRSLPLEEALSGRVDDGEWLVLLDDVGIGRSLVDRLSLLGQRVIRVAAECTYAELERDSFRIDPRDPAHYARLAETLRERGYKVRRVVHGWSLKGTAATPSISDGLDLGYFSLLFLIQALARGEEALDASVLVITSESQSVAGSERVDPAKSALPALCKVTSQELSKARCTVVDLPPPGDPAFPQQCEKYAKWLLADIARAGSEPVVAYRGGARFVQSYERIDLPQMQQPEPVQRERGLYVITGGLGGIGLALAGRLARDHRASLLLLTREPLPDRSMWDGLAARRGESAVTAARVRRIRELEALGARVTVKAIDLTDVNAVREALAEAEQGCGPLRGVFHLAADLKHRSIRRRIADLNPGDVEAQLRPKVRGMLALCEALHDRSPDFVVAFSSNAAALGGIGFGAYSAANAMLDSVVAIQGASSSFPWMVINWDGWITSKRLQAHGDPYALSTEQGLDVLWRLLALRASSQIVVSVSSFERRVNTWVRQGRAAQTPAAESPASEAGSMENGEARANRVQPRTELERTIAGIWADVLGQATLGTDQGGLPQIGVEDGFLALGGDSLIGLRILSRIKDRFGVDVPMVALMGERGTVAGLAAEVAIRLAELHDAVIVDEKLATLSSSAA